MKITPEQVRQLANHFKLISAASHDISLVLTSIGAEPEPEQSEFLGTTVLTYSKELQAAAKVAVETIDPPIEHSEAYLASKRACVEVAPEPAPEPVKAEPVTRLSLRTLAEKLVVQGKLPDVKTALSKFNASSLSNLKPEHYEAVNAEFSALIK